MSELSQSRINYTHIKHLPVEYMGQFLDQEEVRVLIVEKKYCLLQQRYEWQINERPSVD